MQVTVEQRAPSKVELKIEVEAEKVAETTNKVYREFAQSTAVPGFRQGKAPRRILERYVKPESVRRRTVEMMIPQAYREALEHENIRPYADPELEVIQLEAGQPFVFKAKVPLPPKVELGEYKGIEVKRPEVKVTDADVEARLKYLQESRTTAKKVEDRGVQIGDIVVADIASAVQGEEKGAPKRSLVDVGTNVPGFDANVVGLKPGERKVFTVEYPKDFPDKEMAEKKVDFDVAVEAIREREVPELNDDFAKAIGDFKTLADLREDIRARLAASAEQEADREVERKIVDETVARSKVDFPDVLVEHEMGHDLEDIKRRLDRQGLSLEQYLQQIGQTQDQFLSELREAVTRRVRIGLVLVEIANVEKTDVADEEVDAEIERIAADSKATRESVEAYIEARGGRSSLRNSLLTRKITDHLRSVSKIK